MQKLIFYTISLTALFVFAYPTITPVASQTPAENECIAKGGYIIGTTTGGIPECMVTAEPNDSGLEARCNSLSGIYDRLTFECKIDINTLILDILSGGSLQLCRNAGGQWDDTKNECNFDMAYENACKNANGHWNYDEEKDKGTCYKVTQYPPFTQAAPIKPEDFYKTIYYTDKDFYIHVPIRIDQQTTRYSAYGVKGNVPKEDQEGVPGACHQGIIPGTPIPAPPRPAASKCRIGDHRIVGDDDPRKLQYEVKQTDSSIWVEFEDKERFEEWAPSYVTGDNYTTHSFEFTEDPTDKEYYLKLVPNEEECHLPRARESEYEVEWADRPVSVGGGGLWTLLREIGKKPDGTPIFTTKWDSCPRIRLLYVPPKPQPVLRFEDLTKREAEGKINE